MRAQNINRIVISPTASWRGGAGAFWGKKFGLYCPLVQYVCCIRAHFPPPGNEEDFLFKGFRFPIASILLLHLFRHISKNKIQSL